MASLSASVRTSHTWSLLLKVEALLLAAALLATPAAVAAEAKSSAEIREELEALGYVETADETSSTSGVTKYEAGRVQPGINLYCSSSAGEVRLLTNEGKVWKSVKLLHKGVGDGCYVEPLGDDAFVAVSRPVVSVFDSRGEVRWSSDADHHHEVAQGPDGAVYTLTARPGILKRRASSWPILDHAITKLDDRGDATERLVLSDLFRDRIDPARLARMQWAKKLIGSAKSRKYVRASDVFHPNSLRVLDRPLAGASVGDILMCIRELDLVAIVDLESRSVVWEWGPGELDAPHHATILENGHILVFDNGRARRWSRVVEVDPERKKIVWQYRADGFFSKIRGAAQRLPNGNTLVTESTKGRVFEITPDGQVVWEFWAPEVTEDGERHQVYRMIRLPLTP